MIDMEMRNGYEFNAENALREEIMFGSDRFFMMGSNKSVVNAERERFLSAIFSGRAFRG